MFKDNCSGENKEVEAYTAYNRHRFRNTGLMTPCTLWLFMLRLNDHEHNLMRLVAWFMGYYLGDALLDWLIWVPKLEQAIQQLPPGWSKLTPEEFVKRKLIPHETMKVLFRIVYPRCELGLRAEVYVDGKWTLHTNDGYLRPRKWIPHLPPKKNMRFIGSRKRDNGAWHPLRLLPALERRITRSGPRRALPRLGALQKNPQARGKRIDGGWVLRRLFHKTGGSFFGPCRRNFWCPDSCFICYNHISHIQRTRAEKYKTKTIQRSSRWTDRGVEIDTRVWRYDRWCADPQRPYLVTSKYDKPPVCRAIMLFIPDRWDAVRNDSFGYTVDYKYIDKVYRLPN